MRHDVATEVKCRISNEFVSRHQHVVRVARRQSMPKRLSTLGATFMPYRCPRRERRARVGNHGVNLRNGLLVYVVAASAVL